MWIQVYRNWKTNLNSKNGKRRSFCCETKTSISLIPTRRMCLWCSIMERKEIIMSINVYPNWKTNFNSKNGNKRSFSYETKDQYHLSQWGEYVYDAQSWKERRLLCESRFILIERWTSITKMVERDFFTWNQSTNIIYPIKENVFMMPNHQKKGDYYVNPCWSQLKVKLQFYKW